MVPLISGLVAACGDVRDDPMPNHGPSPSVTAPKLTIEQLRDPITCSDCHQDHFREWSGSMHAYASVDPVFRAMNARGQKETNGALGDFCVKCHAPMALALGLTTDGLNLDSLDDKSVQGVTCYFCHDTEDVPADPAHNNPLVLANDAVMRGPVKSPLEFGHRGEYSEWFDDNVKTAGFKSTTFCGSCHDIVVPAHLSGASQDVPLEQTFQEWRSSVFAAPEDPDAGVGLHANPSNRPLNCTSGGGCHMKRETNVPIASPVIAHPTMPTRTYRHQHDFPAVDTALVDFPEKDAQAELIQDKFKTEFRIALCADLPGSVRNTIVLQLENLSAGHYLPSGASQDRRLWVEVHAYQQGAEIFQSGVVPPGVAATSVPGTWILYDRASKADGSIAHMFWDVAKLDGSQTIPVSTPDLLSGTDANRLNHTFQYIRYPDRVTMTIWVEAIGLDVIDDILGSGTYLDPSIRDKVGRFAVQLYGPPFAPTPAGSPVTFEWTVEAALAAAHDNNTTQIDGQQCVEFPAKVNVTAAP
jgi:hypothetical protein